MVKNGQKWSKMVKNGQKWSKMVKNGQKWSNFVKKWSSIFKCGEMMFERGQNIAKYG